jgi:choline-sulfatase
MLNKPNILWLCTDQQRFDTIRALGNQFAQTPNLDKLVEQGTSFNNAYCQSPVCAPSRASFLTGRYPRTTRCRQNGQSIPSDELLISKIFANAGYRCGLAGKLHLASCSDGKVEKRTDDGYDPFHWSHHPQPDWEENEYTKWLTEQGQDWYGLQGEEIGPYVRNGPPAEYSQTTWCAEKTIEFIKSEQGKPWFFSFNCFDPHHPFDPPKEYLEKFNFDDMPLPSIHPKEADAKTTFQKLDRIWAHNNPGEFHVERMTDDDRRKVYAAYMAMVSLIDDQVGRILDALEETGQSADTLVVFMSDHGEMLGDHGIYFKGPHFYDCQMRVPLIMRWPNGQVLQNRQVHGFVELIDLMPTFLEAAGLEIPSAVQGKSLLPLLQGGDEREYCGDQVYAEYYNAWTHKEAYGTMLRTECWKIVVYHGTNQGEFYDLKNDPQEFFNLWDHPDFEREKQEYILKCFDASVLSMDPDPPRLGPF